MLALRSKDWKYVHYPGQPLGELYDLRNDPDEFDNRWNDPARRRLRDECRDRWLNACSPAPILCRYENTTHEECKRATVALFGVCFRRYLRKWTPPPHLSHTDALGFSL